MLILTDDGSRTRELQPLDLLEKAAIQLQLHQGGENTNKAVTQLPGQFIPAAVRPGGGHRLATGSQNYPVAPDGCAVLQLQAKAIIAFTDLAHQGAVVDLHAKVVQLVAKHVQHA